MVLHPTWWCVVSGPALVRVHRYFKPSPQLVLRPLFRRPWRSRSWHPGIEEGGASAPGQGPSSGWQEDFLDLGAAGPKPVDVAHFQVPRGAGAVAFSEKAWMDQVLAVLGTQWGRDTCRRGVRQCGTAIGVVRPETVAVVAGIDAQTAKSATGQEVRTSHATVARTVGCSAKTVQRARLVLEALGFSVTVERGRLLSRAEKAQAFEWHGGRQWSIASHRALVMPELPASVREEISAEAPAEGNGAARTDSRSSGGPVDNQGRPCLSGQNVPLVISTQVEITTYLGLYSPTRLRAQVRKQSSTPRQRLRPTKRRGRTAQEAAPAACRRLAGQLARRWKWTDPNGRPYQGFEYAILRLSRVLERFGIDDRGWLPGDVDQALEARNREVGMPQLANAQMRDPVAFFAAQLPLITAMTPEPPETRRARERAAQQAVHQQWLEAEAAHAAQVRADRARDPHRGKEVVALAKRLAAEARRKRTAAPAPS